MSRYLYNTISALVRDLAATCDGGLLHSEVVHADIMHLVLEQLTRMPWFLRAGVKFSTAAFGASRLFLEGAVYHRREPRKRAVQVKAWKKSRLAICRDLMTFYTSLVVLSLCSNADSESCRDIS